MDAVHPALFPLYLPGKISSALIYGSVLGKSLRNRTAVSVDFIPVLLCHLRKADCRRYPAGAGAMKEFVVATFTDLTLRVILAFVFSGILGSATGIWLAWPVGWLIATVISLFYYRRLFAVRS